MIKFDIKKYLWLAYPVVTALLLLVSSSYVFSAQFWQSLGSKQSQVELDGQMAANLKAKLARLQATNQTAETANLQSLLRAQPANKPVRDLVSSLSFAGVQTGVPLQAFRGTAGDLEASTSGKPASPDELKLSLTATYQTASREQVLALLMALEQTLPLNRITDVRYQPGLTEIVIEAVWAPLPSLVSSIESAIPETSAGLAKLQQTLGAFTHVALASESAIQLPISPNPF